MAQNILPYCGEKVYAGRSTIEPPHAAVEIGGEGHPEKIGDLQPRGEGVNLAHGENHPYNLRPEYQQPDEGQAVGLEVEEDEAPEKIKGQLNEKKAQAVGPGGGVRGEVDPGPADAHQGKQNAPDNGKDDGRGGRGEAFQWPGGRSPSRPGSASRRGPPPLR